MNSITVVAKHMPGDYAVEYASPWAGATFFPCVRPSEEVLAADLCTLNLFCSFSERSLEAQQWEAESWSEFCRLASSVPESGVRFTSTAFKGLLHVHVGHDRLMLNVRCCNLHWSRRSLYRLVSSAWLTQAMVRGCAAQCTSTLAVPIRRFNAT